MSNPLGRAYLFDYDQAQGSTQPMIPSYEAEPSFIEEEKPLSNLESIDGITENYFNSFANLQSFSRTARKRYGVDVTNPDLSDPLQQYLHKAFLKLHSQTASMGQALQQGRKAWEQDMESRATNPDYRPSTEQGEYGTTKAGYTTGLMPGTESQVSAWNRSFENSEDKEAALQQKKNNVNYYKNLLAKETDPGIRESLRNTIRTLESAIPADDIQAPRTWDNSRGAVSMTLKDIYTPLYNLKKDGLSAITSSPNVTSANYVVHDGDLHVEVVDNNNKVTWIPLRNAEAGIKAIQGFMTKAFGTTSFMQSDLSAEDIVRENQENYDKILEEYKKGSSQIKSDIIPKIDNWNKDDLIPLVDKLNKALEVYGDTYAPQKTSKGAFSDEKRKILSFEFEKNILREDKIYLVLEAPGQTKGSTRVELTKSNIEPYMDRILNSNPMWVSEFVNLGKSNNEPKSEPKEYLFISPEGKVVYLDEEPTEDELKQLEAAGYKVKK